MARGSPAPNALPKVSFVKVTDEVTQQPQGVHDHVARSYGYNDFNDDFVRPEEHYIRYIEPLESDLATQVEYDMDEQDQEWLDAVNMERKAQQLDKVSYETFEIIMDRLEKEWFDLSKNIPKSDMALPSEDSTCAICDDSEGENTNAIVFCDGCNLAVHQDCYGVPYIPEGQWLCRKCTVSPENPVSCILCPNEGGAFKQTVSGDWVHLLCAIWVPETAVANDVFMEPITGVEKISKQRWRLRCSVCDIREGACIQCSKASCFTAFHATCARKEKLLMPMKATQGSEAPTLACYCEKHLPREQQEARAAALRSQRAEDSDADSGQANAKSNKTARAYAKTYKPGPPLVPRIIVNRILQYISRISVRHKPEFVQLVCRYWSLKREARRGAPLLKRLHLEPWTALSGSKQQTDEEKVMKLDYMRRLRLDLERVRLIIDVIRHRESTKQKQQEQIQLVLSRFFFPHEPALRFTFEKIISHDRQGYFKSPVNKNEVPDYYDIIKEPMCWDIIDQKLDSHEYLDLVEFKRDVELVIANAMTYNEVNTPYYKTASRIHGYLPHLLADLERTLSMRPSVPKIEQLDTAHLLLAPDASVAADRNAETEQPAPAHPPSATPVEDPRPQTGDLEPPLNLLDLLVSEELVRQDTNVVMMSTPIESLLSYELPNIRPPAPPPPQPKSKARPVDKGKRKRPKIDRKAALERKRQERLHALDLTPGFRAPRTRAARAAANAFDTEASQPPETEGAESSPAAEVKEYEHGPSTSSSKAERSRKPRKSAAADVPDDLPLTVDSVDNRKSFTMFERGWILPPDQRRRGRAPIERQPYVPPKKKAKTDIAAPDTHQALSSVQSEHVETHSASEPAPVADTPMDVDVPPTEDVHPELPSSAAEHQEHHGAGPAEAPEKSEAQEAEPAQRPQAEPSQSEEQPQEEEEEEDPGPPRVIIIEELDTPATRREKNMRKKLERQAAREAAAREAEAASVASARPSRALEARRQQPQAGSSRLSSDAIEDGSDLTDLSDGEENSAHQDVEIPSSAGPGLLQQPQDGPLVYRSSRRAPPSAIEREPGAITLKPGEKLEGGTLVYAGPFPWWPAVVFEEDDPEVPESVATQAPPPEPDLELVRFYEKKHINNWAWVRHRNMRYLGEDDSLDAQMLAPTSKYQRWRSSARRTECRHAYQDALAEMEADGQAQPEPSPGTGAQRSRAHQPQRGRNVNTDSTSVETHGAHDAPAGVGDPLVPAAMGADSPMTDVDSVE
ncbi:hypothetical protein C8Q77DRAFT_1063453 [Trametes polyzona]|nr:hypothetical protein C8Q77DRAFT_1063453 [Trametes polyzona]